MRDGSLDLKTYWGIVTRWWWLFALSAAIAGGLAYYASVNAPRTYSATTRVAVEYQRAPGAPSGTDIENSAVLAQSYAGMITTRPVLEQIAQKLPQRYSLGSIENKLSVTSRGNVISITATDSHPVMAATLANTAASTFIDWQLSRQLAQLQQVEQVLESSNIQDRAAIVQARASLLGILSIVEPAVPPSQPATVPVERNVLIAAAVGIVIAGIGVLLIEYFDDSVSSLEDLEAASGLPALGSIPRYRGPNTMAVTSVRDDRKLNFVIESYRFLRTNLDFVARSKSQFTTLLVTSPGMNEGKTTTAINLAISLAKGGKSVILVDADMRVPSIQRVFGVDRAKGLREVLLGEASVDQGLHATPIEGLKVMPAGAPVPDPTTALRSPMMAEIMEELKRRADVVVFDSPPLFAVADSLLLASMVDGVLLIAYARRTSRESAAKAARLLQQTNPAPPFIGTVLVNFRGKEWHHYYDYYAQSRKSDERMPDSKVAASPVTIILSVVLLLMGALGIIVFSFPTTLSWLRQLIA